MLTLSYCTVSNMELGTNLEETRDAYQRAKDAENQAEQGEAVVLLLKTPSQGTHAHSFKVGVTVAYVKLLVEQSYGIPMAKCVLKIAGKPLLDPLSLSDCPAIKPGGQVEVEVSST